MNLLLITIEYVPFRGGVANYLRNLVVNFSTSDQDKFCVLTNKSDLIDSEPKVFRHKLLFKYFRPRWLLSLFWACFYVKKIKPDMLIISHILPIGIVALIINKLLKTPFGLIIHGYDFKLAFAQSKLKAKIADLIIRNAKIIVANSDYTANLIREKYPHLNINVSKPCPSLWDFKDRSFDFDVWSKQFEPSTNLRLLTVCRLVERKGIDLVIRAVWQLKKSGILVDYAIIGLGDFKSQLEKLISELSLADQIKILENQTDLELADWYKSCDVFAMTPRQMSSDVEGFGIAFLDAPLFKKPTIAANSGGTSEALLDGQTGLMIPENGSSALVEAIKMLQNKDLRLKLGNGGFAWLMNNFDPKIRGQEFHDIISGAKPMPIQQISIIIPTYQHAKTIEKCLVTIFKQTYQNYEIIVVNDGSTDNTLDILKKYSNKIKIVNQNNRGSNPARNAGVKLATGDYVLFCDADLIMKPDFIEKLAMALKNSPQADFAFSSYKFGWKKFRIWPFDMEKLRRFNYIHTTSLIRRDKFPGFDDSLKKFQDWDLWLTMHEQGSIGVWVPEILFTVIPNHNGHQLSVWLPKIFYKIPWHKFGIKMRSLEKYRTAEAIIKIKHNL